MSEVDAYIEKTTSSQQVEFERIQKIVKQIVPESEVLISYGIPTFTYKGKYLLYFGAFKHHMSLFPGSYLIDELKDELKNFKVAKGTIQYNSNNLVPEHVVKQLLKMRKATLDSV